MTPVHVTYPGHVHLTVTCDTGPLGDLQTLAYELDDQAVSFGARTSQVPGVLGVCLRSLPADLGRRSTTRYDRRGDALDVDLTIAEELLAGTTLDEQRELVGPLLRDLLRHGTASRSAPWTVDQRAEVLAAVDETLQRIGWLDGRRSRARLLLAAEVPLLEVGERLGLALTEVEDLYATLSTLADTARTPTTTTGADDE